MTATSALLAPAAAPHARVARATWIESPLFDSLFFILSPAVGLIVILASHGDSRTLAPLLATSLLGFPHYFSTFTFYFWDENRQQHAMRWFAFFAGPALIVLMTVALFAFHVPYAIAVVTYFWNCIHVSRQSCGILSLYRHRTGRTSNMDKAAPNAAIILTNLWFVLWRTETYPTLHRWLSLPDAGFPRLLWMTTGVLAVAAIVRLAWNLIRRSRSGHPASSVEVLFIVTSIGMFHPYLWVDDPALATIAMLTGHFIQYLGIVWLLHRRKYAVTTPSTEPRWLQTVSTNTPALLATLGGTGLLTLSVFTAFRFTAHEAWFEVMYMSLAFTHFYLDGLFWAFKNPHVRSTIGPYFAPPASA